MWKNVIRVVRKARYNVTVDVNDNGNVIRIKVPVANFINGRVKVEIESQIPIVIPTDTEVVVFEELLRNCVLKSISRMKITSIDVDACIKELAFTLNKKDTSNFSVMQKWLLRYRGIEKSSSHIGYLYVSAYWRVQEYSGYIKGYKEVPYLNSVHSENEIDCYEDRSEIVLDALLDYFASNPVLDVMSRDQRRKLVAIVYNRWAYIRDNKPYDPISEFEAKYMGFTLSEAEDMVSKMVIAVEHDKEDIKTFVRLGFPARQAQG